MKRILSWLALAGAFALAGPPDRAADVPVLWYRQPAGQWIEALPIGNGRLGAMVFGGVQLERLQLNEGTLWAGGPYDPANPAALPALPKIRALLAAGKNGQAQELAGKDFMAKPLREAQYETLGDLLLTMSGSEAAKGYRRELNLDTAIARTQFQIGDAAYVRECFSSAPDQVIVLRLSARNAKHPQQPAPLSFTLAMDTPQSAAVQADPKGELVLRGVNTGFETVKPALRFEARVRVLASGGRITADAAQLHVDGASSVTILVAAATSFRSYHDVSGDPDALNLRTLAAAQGKGFEALRAAHVADYQRLFRRVSIDLGHSAADKLPTDERVRAADPARDPALAALYFQYGRYLLISSSRPGGQPATLQGLWNDSLHPPWGSKYTININTEMNYWPAEETNLAECAEPLYAMIADLSHTGSKMAHDIYGAGGWVAHHNTDLWRATGPIDGPAYGVWPCGGAWLCDQLWEHYLFEGDRDFLARAYPLMKGSAQFFLDTLVVEHRHHWLVDSPSLSPEHKHHDGVALAEGPTIDEQIIRDLFSHCIAAAQILGQDQDFASQLAAARDRLAPTQIGAQGQVQEWLDDWDAQAPEQQHRHVSMLYGFYPSDQITLRGTPRLAAAVRKSLEIRGDYSTGWATAWRLNLWARLQDAEHAYKILQGLLGPERTYPNLFDAHPPFQIDGNFGGTAGIAEMLLQSQAGEIELLPALPRAWPTGHVEGLRARGGFTVDLEWRDGALVSATLRGAPGADAHLRCAGRTTILQLSPSGSISWDGKS
ncbi:MAG TPA: glycoside hydrolase family 95 protein [Opitutaceae bacterium]|nr:glycoside hydrolase family 95 protein [Opitutaceae bacterium]